MQKNQNDLIFSIVFVVLALIAIGVAYGTKQDPPAIAAPTPVVTTDAQPPATAVVYGNALPSGATAGGTGATGMPGMPGMGRPGMGGPSMSGSMPPGGMPPGAMGRSGPMER